MSVALWDRPEKVAWLTARGLTEDTILDAELGYVDEGRYRDCISIPYRDARGEVATVRYRHLDPNALHKYDQIKGSRLRLYNVRNTDRSVVAICEGEFDSLIMGQLGVPAVAVPGATSWQKAWRWLFRNCDLVYVITDADESGRKAGNKIIGQVGSITDVAAIHLPNGKDVTDVFLEDPSLLRRLLA